MISDLLLKAQTNNDKEATLSILETFKPKVKSSLLQVPYEHRADLEQELYAKMIEVIQTFK